ncbi:MAG: I78 family peptidase inhibitor [Paracoccus sp. (in: a-proteobacteria)]|uniref:I78 family peptidase inhibitor n=1 Tax=Paracoccus sp. TaxID=267 RepID=UPI0026E069C2|nr:I78 family peptidase inhibitor [Paracoccus sp. (in: a-proteobacteria)]MDO5632286.1 I78 family peptidase inhibitor [Paracoccus sp. (in: a-proteobacteria)]
MKSTKLLSLIAAPALLAACTVVQPVETVPVPVPVVPAGDTCNAAAYQAFVGQRSPEISLPAGTEFRHYRSGDPVTMDHVPTRLNFEYDRRGVLTVVKCG